MPPSSRLPRVPGSEGLRSEALQAAFKTALAGNSAELEDLLARHGGLPGPRPNSKLAAAFGAEINGQTKNALPLLMRLAEEDAPVDDSRAFLPVAAVHGFCSWLRKGGEEQGKAAERVWAAIAALAADPRLPVRLGTVDALIAMCAHPGYADALVARAASWMDEDDRELRFATGAALLMVLSQAQAVSSLRDHEAALEYVSRVLAAVESSPRSADRSEARRRVLLVLSQALCTLVPRISGERGIEWLTRECELASQPLLRAALSDTVVRLHKDSQGLGRAAIDELRKTLEGSAAPRRDGTVIRPGTGRGKSGRKIR